jgi:hypothetical protein
MKESRAGLDLLLKTYPDADVALVLHQQFQTNYPPYVADGYGPWTCVDLITNGERWQFAIWNSTGDVYRVQRAGDKYPGAVEEDPYLEIRNHEVTPRQ